MLEQMILLESLKALMGNMQYTSSKIMLVLKILLV